MSESPETTPLSAPRYRQPEMTREDADRHDALYPDHALSTSLSCPGCEAYRAARTVPAAEPRPDNQPDPNENPAILNIDSYGLPRPLAVPAADDREWEGDVRTLAWFAMGAAKGKPRDAARRVLGWLRPGQDGAVPAAEPLTPRNANPTRADVWYTPDCGHLHLSDNGMAHAACPDGAVPAADEDRERHTHDGEWCGPCVRFGTEHPDSERWITREALEWTRTAGSMAAVTASASPIGTPTSAVLAADEDRERLDCEPSDTWNWCNNHKQRFTSCVGAGVSPSTGDDRPDPLMNSGGWTITIKEHSTSGPFEPPEQWVSVEWSSWGVAPIHVNHPEIAVALDEVRAEYVRRFAALSTGAPDTGSQYGSLLAERDRLVASGVDPADLDVPLAPETEEPS